MAERRRFGRLAMTRRSDWLLALVDVATVTLVLLVSDRLLQRSMTPTPTWYVALGVAVVLCGRVTGLYRRGALRPGAMLSGPAVATGGGGASVALAAVMTSEPGPGFAWPALVWVGLVAGLLTSRTLLARSRRALVPLGVGLERYAVLGESVADAQAGGGSDKGVRRAVPRGRCRPRGARRRGHGGSGERVASRRIACSCLPRRHLRSGP